MPRAKAAEVTLSADKFRVGRVIALQPRLSLPTLLHAVMRTEDPAILHNIANVVRMWASSRHDLPGDFCEQVQIRAVSRQPLSFVAIDAEYVERTVKQYQEPFSTEQCDSAPWPTDDLFLLLPLEELSFPNDAVTREQPLAGQQSVHECETCAGAGRQNCAACDESGHVDCPGCDGAKRVVCTRCGGAGTHVGVRGNLVNCQLCHTRGTLRCERCNGRGEVVCQACGGDGHIVCATCLGFRRMLRRWSLVETTSTRKSHDQQVSSAWPFRSEELIGECDTIWNSQWRFDGTIAGDQNLTGLPEDIASRAAALVAASTNFASNLDPARQRLIGLRAKVLATYVYRVEFDYAGKSESLVLGGVNNRVYTRRGAQRQAGWLRRTRTWCGRAFSHAWTGDQPVLDRTYLDAVQKGEVHIADSRCLMRAVRKILSAQIVVSEFGYTATFSGHNGLPCVVEMHWDVDPANQLLLCFTSRLGTAHRDSFPALLELNHRLSFGRFAAVVEPGVAGATLLLVDRRPYDTITAEHCATILTAIAADIRQVRQNAVVD